MATTNLTINLGVATGKMAKGFRTAKSQINSFTATVKSSMMSGLAPFIGLLGGALSIRAFTSFIRNAQESIDKIAKLSVGLGMTTEQLSSYELAAKLSGLEMEQFTRVAAKMIKSVADANNGLATQVRAFETLGLNARMMAGLSTDEQFKAIAEAVKTLGWNTETAGAAMDIFGTRIGPKMAAMLMQGRSGIEAMQERMEKIGGVMTGIDAAKVEMANDAMTELGMWVQSIGRSLAVNLAPIIKTISDLLLDMGIQFNGSMDAGRAFASVISTGLRVVLNIADVLYRAFEVVRIQFNAVLYAVAIQIEYLAKAINSIYETSIGMDVENAMTAFRQGLGDAIIKDASHVASQTFWGEEFEKNRKESERKMELEARKIAKQREAFNATAMPEMSTTQGKTPDVAAVQRGTMEAFKAIAEANKTNPVISLTEKVVANTKAIADAVRRDEVRFVSIELL